MPARIVHSQLLSGGKVAVDQSAEAVQISVAPEYRQAIDTIIVLKLDRDALTIPAISGKSSELTAAAKAAASGE